MKRLELQDIGSIEVVYVKSKAIERIMWDHRQGQMMIKFKDSPVYVYPTAPRTLFNEFVAAESKGRFFLANIKKQHKNFLRLDN